MKLKAQIQERVAKHLKAKVSELKVSGWEWHDFLDLHSLLFGIKKDK